ncbi:DUF6440 family protein [Tumebacillus sp. DT12]|uniref:DUF6440 family protein n=1 Tax=Tumebacillus lacus TaxID=2995335 RepID=A0ABT3X0E2_9BACL|nr:DUF6440 family protein [Tumebacillus lacus]MCX7570378.1 DUF6440 family protein [Tumebacillus lacus]
MNRIAIICLMCLGAITAVVGCTEQTSAKQTSRFAGWDRVVVITDQDTGCQYLMPTGTGGTGLTPLLDANGRPICGKQ